MAMHNKWTVASLEGLLKASQEAVVALQEAGIEICRYPDHDPRVMGYVESARRALMAAISKAEG